MAFSHSYRHLVVKNGNFTLLLTSSGQEWQFLVFRVNLGMWPPQIDRLRKTSTVPRVSTHIYGVSKEIDGKTFIFRINLGMWPLKSIVLEKWPKTCTLNLQLLHNTKRPTKWSGHVKKIDPPKRTSTYERPFIWEGNYLVIVVVSNTWVFCGICDLPCLWVLWCCWYSCGFCSFQIIMFILSQYLWCSSCGVH